MMPQSRHPRCVLLGMLALLPAIALAGLPGAEFGDVIANEGRVYISGQPTEKGLELIRDQGITTVISLRTPGETKKLYDEAAAAEALGLQFIQIPSGGDDHPFAPETLADFSEAMRETDGKVLVHCRTGVRATHMWVAWLISDQGVDPAEAVSLGRRIQFGGTPLEGYLGDAYEFQLVPKGAQ